MIEALKTYLIYFGVAMSPAVIFCTVILVWYLSERRREIYPAKSHGKQSGKETQQQDEGSEAKCIYIKISNKGGAE